MQQQWWLVYVRWSGGRREMIRCTAPEQLVSDKLWVLACLPEPTISVVRRR